MPPIRLRAPITAALGLAAFLAARTAAAQVNTDPLRPGPSRAGWGAGLDASFTLLRGNTDLLDFGAGGRVTYQTLYPAPPVPEGERPALPLIKTRVYMMGNVRYTTRASGAIVNQGLLHARLTQSLLPALNLNLFAQHQFNEFQRLRVRSLWGTSLGAQIVRARAFSLTAATGYMLELNRISVLPGARDAPQTIEHRMANFLGVMAMPIEDKLFLQSTTYLQPRFDRFSDLRFLEELELLTKVSDILSVGATGSVLVDTAPPTGVKPTDMRVYTVVRVSY